jgi:hypothetical protein
MKVVMNHASYRFCEDLNDLFTFMFPDSDVATKFSLGKDKVRYAIIYGLAPYFHDELCATLREPGVFYSLSFDESLNKSLQLGQMDIHVRYWNAQQCKAVTRYLTSSFMGAAKADDLLVSFKEGIKDINEDGILQISMDGPNVNWCFHKKFIKEKSDDTMRILDCGSCGLHIMHGSL